MNRALWWLRDQRGVSLVESLVAVALLGVAVIAPLSALSTGLLAEGVADEGVTAQSLARSQLEEIKAASYAPTYSAIQEPGYNVSVGVTSLDANMQKITVTILRDGRTLQVVEDYKVNR
ncbi:MAG: prepilin-type N-terminal cleavage/methylation domain-containing protein [Chloroflexota bacterium]|nr:prepilin-type N-terminal cleavage/methylation domain-containing protein [Chloroflexota bacterium]